MEKFRAEKQLIESILKKSAEIPFELIQEPGTLLKLLRNRMNMTQRQLSKRSGIRQANIARFESGKQKPSLRTIEKLFEAMGYSLAVFPISETPIDQILESRALKKAKENMKMVLDNMALEDQVPTKDAIRRMIEDEKERLLRSASSTIWDD